MTLVSPIAQFQKRVAEHPDKPYLNQPRNGDWTTYTWAEVDRQARIIAAGLIAKGLNPGDRVAIFSSNCAEWAIADFAIAMAGMISVPIYSSAGASTVDYVLEHSGSKVLFVGDHNDEQALHNVLSSNNDNVLTIGFRRSNCQESWADWLDTYTALTTNPDPAIEDTYTIVYTSGSTGQPKGVVLSNANVCAAAQDTVILYPGNGHRVLSYLPMAHITERSIVLICSLYLDMQIFFNESIQTFIHDLQHTRPTFFITVPRLWAKFQSNIIAKIPDARLQLLLKIPFVGKFIAARIRKQMGFDACRLFLSGSAPISPDLLRWYYRLGIPISEGWGMSETAGAACANIPFDVSRLGTIGIPFPNVEFKIAENEELLIRGESIFSEYFNDPEKTAESFENGWFKTGDRAEQTPDGAWKIIGRTKDQFKTSKGKYVTPTLIENRLGASSIIEQCCVVGAGLSQPVALVVLAELDIDHNATIAELKNTLHRTNESLESHEKLDHIIVLAEAFSPENGLLTPTLKLRRSEIEERYKGLVNRDMNTAIVWETEL